MNSRQTPENFSFNISLSVLNHLGRNLYRNFITVLGEAISNSWDADAGNVWIYIDREGGNFVIKDDGLGMSENDFRHKFLKVGYSKRGDGSNIESIGGRPYIGRKGIGKLALLSCAERISIISKMEGSEYVGGTINNSDLDNAISEDSTNYDLEIIDSSIFDPHVKEHNRGTIIYFEDIHDGVKNTLSYLKKILALYFRFSLIDSSFNIFLNDEKITEGHLSSLAENTQFLWNINTLDDPYINEGLATVKESNLVIISETNIKGFIASVEKPSHLKIGGATEKTGIDLFVNGRLREKNVLKHMPNFATRHVASYLYGQIHCSELDGDEVDRFTTSREGIKDGDPKYEEVLRILKEEVLEKISDEWDEWRLKHKEDGDDENPRKTEKERKALSLYNLSSKDYAEEGDGPIKNWIKELQPEAEFNIPAYVDCFLSENLVRKYIKGKSMPVSSVQSIVTRWRNVERREKRAGNLSINIRQLNDDLFYLDMESLVKVAEPPRDGYPNTLLTDEKQFTPIRNAVMHTALLTTDAKRKLTTIYENIKGRLTILLFGNNE